MCRWVGVVEGGRHGMAEKETVLDRVRKLRAVAERTTNQHEAENALLLAQRLMIEHDLEEASVEGACSAEDEVVDADADEQSHRPTGWRNEMASIVAGNFRCAHYLEERWEADRQGRVLRFVGRTQDVRLAVEVYRQALVAATRLADLHVATRRRARVKRSTLLLWRKSFLLGFAAGLGQRFAQQRDAHPEWGLVLVRDPEVDKTLGFLLGGEGVPWSSRASRTVEQGAWGAGFQAGAAFDPQARRLPGRSV